MKKLQTLSLIWATENDSSMGLNGRHPGLSVYAKPGKTNDRKDVQKEAQFLQPAVLQSTISLAVILLNTCAISNYASNYCVILHNEQMGGPSLLEGDLMNLLSLTSKAGQLDFLTTQPKTSYWVQGATLTALW